MIKNELEKLYGGIIYKHFKNPLNRIKIKNYSHNHEGFNPLCGDKIFVYLNIVDGKIVDIGYEPAACAVCVASASILTEQLKGVQIQNWNDLYSKFKVITNKDNNSNYQFDITDDFSKALVEIKKFPSRMQCALLPLESINKALLCP